MMQKAMIKKPQFANEAEEAEWYAANPDYILQQLEIADAEGRLGHGTAAKRLGLKPRVPAQILLQQEDFDLASSQAQGKGLDFHVYVESLLHEALVNAQRQFS